MDQATMIPATARDTRPRVLVVDDEAATLDVIDDLLTQKFHGHVIRAASLAEARDLLKSEPIDIMVTDVHLPDGDGMTLLPALHKARPDASAIVITGIPSLDGAISALRQGAADFLPKPFSADQFTHCVGAALEQQQARGRNNRHTQRLRRAVRRLGQARQVVTKKVDLLCNDLVSAYSELSRQLDTVRLQQGFCDFIGDTTDLEQLLCHTMDWLLRQMGYCNIGIWLAAEDDDYQLGAYMKYTIPGQDEMIEAIGRNLVPATIRKGTLHLGPAQAKELLTPAEQEFLANQDILAVNCTYLAEPLGVLVLFRDSSTPFTDANVANLQTLSPLLAVALTRSIKQATAGHHPHDGDERDGDGPFDDPKHDGPDPSDWWKRGEAPPF